MINPKDYVVTKDDAITDVDLDVEEVQLLDGRRLTEELAEQLSEQTLAEARRRNLVPGEKVTQWWRRPLPAGAVPRA